MADIGGIISGLLEEEALELAKQLHPLDEKIYKKIDYLIEKSDGDLTFKEALEYVINDSIILWAKVHLNWEARDYQIEMLKQAKSAKRLVLRLGRRLGKSEVMVISVLWHAFRQPNPRDASSASAYEILILTPFETQIDLLFDRMSQLIDSSPTLTSMVKRNISHRYEFHNGAIIKGLTVGSSSGKGAANTRGQAARLLITDEVDYMGSAEITNIMNIANEDPSRIKVCCASTPSGKHEEFYFWCMNATTSYVASKEDCDNFRFTGFIKEEREKGNGFVQIWAPSIVNKTILEVNPDTGQTYLEDIKDQLTSIRFDQEVFAMFGDMEFGVYKKDLLDIAYALGDKYKTKYWEDFSKEEKAMFKINRAGKILVAAVDFDIAQSTPNILCLMYDKTKPEKYFEVLFRIDIPRTEFLLTSSINKLIELDEEFSFDHVALDRGLGEQAVEMVKQYGQAHPETGLHIKTKGHHFGSSLEIYDPITLKKVKRDFKPFLVDNSVLVFERCKIILNSKDKILKRQLNAYKIEKIGVSGRPIFSSTDEHSVDTLNLCLLTFSMEYDSLFKLIVKGAYKAIKLNMNVTHEWNDRSLETKVIDNQQFEFLAVRTKTQKPRQGRLRTGGNRFKRSAW